MELAPVDGLGGLPRRERNMSDLSVSFDITSGADVVFLGILKLAALNVLLAKRLDKDDKAALDLIVAETCLAALAEEQFFPDDVESAGLLLFRFVGVLFADLLRFVFASHPLELTGPF